MGLRTPLYDWHASRGATMVDFGGWDMPIQYTSIIAEHQATRSAAGLFDICHMGRIKCAGPDAVRFLDHLLSNRVDTLKPGQVRYSLVLNESAGTLDDVLVYRLPEFHLVVVNASNRDKLVSWFTRHRKEFDVSLTDITHAWGMIAVQGPRAIDLGRASLGGAIDNLKYYFAAESIYHDSPVILSRTGYTGEDGFEAILPNEFVPMLWQELRDRGISMGAATVGLGARDTLRLEAAMPLYGHELTEQIDPIQAGLRWAVKSDEKDFIGKAALKEKDPNRPKRVGLRMGDRRIAREGFQVEKSGERVGFISSGTFSPTLGASIAMAFVQPSCAEIGAAVDVVIRDKPAPATVVPLPFYSREKKNG